MENNHDAIKTFRKLVADIRVCMFITAATKEEVHTRPMATVDVEDDGTLWFYTDIRSIKVEEVSQTAKVHLVYAHPGKESFLDVWGNATVVTDKEEIRKKWSPAVKVYFPEGVDTPHLALLKVKPNDVYFWDAGAGRMTALIKIAAALFTSNPALAKGEEGKLKI